MNFVLFEKLNFSSVPRVMDTVFNRNVVAIYFFIFYL